MAQETKFKYLQSLSDPTDLQITPDVGNIASGFKELSYDQWTPLAKQKQVNRSFGGFDNTYDYLKSQNVKGLENPNDTSGYQMVNGVPTTTKSIDDTAKYEALVASGQYKKVPVGNGFGYIPVGGAADQNMKNIGSQMQAGQQVLGSSSQTPPVQPINPNVGSQMSSLGGGFSLSSGNLKVGSNGENVKQLQSLLGITSDGIFGPQTKQAVMAFQQANGLTPDGIVGPKTAAALQAKYGSQTQGNNPTITSNQLNSLGATTASNNGTTASTTGTTPSSVGTTAGTNGTYPQSFQDYINTLTPSADETSIQNQLNTLRSQEATTQASSQLGKVNVENQPIAMPFITGQQAAIERLTGAKTQALASQEVPLVQQLAMAQAKRQAAADVAKAKYEYETATTKTSNTNKPTSVQEYEYAVKNGYTGTYNDYQNLDANRKVAIAKAGVGSNGLTDYQTTQTFLNLSNKYQADGIINNAVKGQTAVSIADQIIANPNSATNQLKSLYTLVKNLDPDSAVREGEITLANQTQSYLQNFGNTLTRIFEGRVVSPATATELAKATKELASAWSQTAQRRQQQYQSQANTAGVGSQFNNYLGGYQSNFSPQSTTGNSYTIKSGDTFFKLAQSLGTSVQALQSANPNVNVNNLQVGQKINLPSGNITTGTTSSGLKYTINP